MQTSSVEKEDLEHIAKHLRSCFSDLAGRSFFITGATGFFGKWLLEAFIFLNDHYELGATIYALSRNPDAFLDKMPHLRRKDIHFFEGDVCTFDRFEKPVDYIIHAATEASDDLNKNHPDLMLKTILKGMESILKIQEMTKAKRVLFTSSGAVYGTVTKDQGNIAESYDGAPSSMSTMSAYGEGKRLSELMGVIAARKNSFTFLSARCFAFIGPHLPIDTHFAVGNFINNVLHHEKIVIKGDGTPLRSYLYPSDLVIWLLTILIKGKSCEAYNLGSDIPVSISELAREVSNSTSKGEVEIWGKPDPSKKVASYVPSIQKAREELGLEVRISLREAIKKTVKWHSL